MIAKKATLLVAIVAMFLAAVTVAQTRTDVSGLWKMNRAKSKFAEGDGPQAITIKFEQKDQTLNETLIIANDGGGERTLNLTYIMDGKPGKNSFGGTEITTTAAWEGPMLVIVFKRDDGSFTRKFTMSPDGKAMTIAVRQSTAGGDRDDTVLLEKQ